MKHKLVVLGCVITLAVLAVLSVQAYDRYQTYHKSVEARITAATEKQAEVDAQRQAQFQAGVRQLEEQCAKDKTAYTALTPFQQLKIKAPNCEVHLVE